MARKNFTADGTRREVAFETHIEKSSWVALRILGSSHTNPIFVLVEQKPIRASTRSAKWCLSGVDKCWEQKKRFIKQDETKVGKTRLSACPRRVSDEVAGVRKCRSKSLKSELHGLGKSASALGTFNKVTGALVSRRTEDLFGCARFSNPAAVEK